MIGGILRIWGSAFNACRKPASNRCDAPTALIAVATDVSGIRPRMAVQVGDRVHLGQTLYHDKRNPEVPFTAPGAGEIVEITKLARLSRG